jgi:hypothetical protein
MEDVKVRTRTGAFCAYIFDCVNHPEVPYLLTRRPLARSDITLRCDHPVVHNN